jgi:hypothetical protein
MASMLNFVDHARAAGNRIGGESGTGLRQARPATNSPSHSWHRWRPSRPSSPVPVASARCSLRYGLHGHAAM